jgi:hypothetical protein
MSLYLPVPGDIETLIVQFCHFSEQLSFSYVNKHYWNLIRQRGRFLSYRIRCALTQSITMFDVDAFCRCLRATGGEMDSSAVIEMLMCPRYDRTPLRITMTDIRPMRAFLETHGFVEEDAYTSTHRPEMNNDVAFMSKDDIELTVMSTVYIKTLDHAIAAYCNNNKLSADDDVNDREFIAFNGLRVEIPDIRKIGRRIP